MATEVEDGLLTDGFKRMPDDWRKDGKITIKKVRQNSESESQTLVEKKDFSGIYAVVDGVFLNYIGQSVHVLARIKQHGWLKPEMKIYYYPIYKEQDRKALETEFIKKFKSHSNSQDNYISQGSDVHLFSKWLTQFQLSDRSRKQYEYYVNHLIEYSEGKTLTSEMVNRFLKEHPRHYVMAAVKYYLRFHDYKFEVLKKLKEPPTIKKVVPKWEELERDLLNIENKDVYWTLKLLYITGARISEILEMMPGSIDKCEDGHFGIHVKGDKYREVAISPEMMTDLKKYIFEEKGLLLTERCFFTESKNSHAAYVRLRDIISKSLPEESQAYLKKTHTFRRSIINWLLKESNYDIVTTKEFIGHEAIETTMRYVSEDTKSGARCRAQSIILAKSNSNSNQK